MKQVQKNKRFYDLLHSIRAGNRPRWTAEAIAEEIYCGRQHLHDVFNNKPGRGKQMRPKLVKFFKKQFEGTWPEILEALGWDEAGNIVPQGTSHVEQSEGGHG